MRVVFVYPALAIWGGVERIWVDKMNLLVNLYGYDVYLLTYNQGSHAVPYPLDERVHHIDLKVQSHLEYHYHGLRRIWEKIYRRLLLRNRMKHAILSILPDVITTTTAGELSLLLEIKGQLPLVVESHSGYDHLQESDHMTLFGHYKLWKCAQLLKKADAIVSLTDSDASKWRLRYKNVYIIPNIAHQNPYKRYSSGENKRVISVCRFAEQKGIPELIAVWRLVYERHPDWQLDVYGEGDCSYFPKENIGLNVHEPISNIFSKYIESSILILTSRYEPFGLVIPEAMSCGIPVVSFEGDGPSSIITEGYDGYVVKNRSVEQMADTICFLIENKSLRKQIGHNAVVTSQRYSIAEIMPKWKSFYAEISRESDLCNSGIK